MRKAELKQQQKILIDLLKNLRKASGVTQVKLAERIGFPQSFISKVESGERKLDVLEIREICRKLGKSFTGFMKRLDRELD